MEWSEKAHTAYLQRNQKSGQKRAKYQVLTGMYLPCLLVIRLVKMHPNSRFKKGMIHELKARSLTGQSASVTTGRAEDTACLSSPPGVCRSAVLTWESVHLPAASLDSPAGYWELATRSSRPSPAPPTPESDPQLQLGQHTEGDRKDRSMLKHIAGSEPILNMIIGLWVIRTGLRWQ